jgi:hypothetical protein
VALDQPIADYETARTWQSSLKEQWGDEPDMTARFDALERFCALTGRDPDAMIADCTRLVETGKRIRIKARREYSEKIAEFQAASGGTPREQQKLGNTVRSFFIHNGIFMQSGLAG